MENKSMTLTLVSRNAKTGMIPVSISAEKTCPMSCPLKGKGCYAEMGPLAIHWRRLSKGTGPSAVSFSQFCVAISKLPEGQIWKHNEAGDLQSDDAINISQKSLRKLVLANKGKAGFTYTHYSPTTGSNGDLVRRANKNGFTVNLSADNERAADEYMKLGVGPVVMVCKSDQNTNFVTKGGNRVVICPNVTNGVQCKDCKLCQRANRSVVIGFPAHGSRKNTVNAALEASK